MMFSRRQYPSITVGIGNTAIQPGVFQVLVIVVGAALPGRIRWIHDHDVDFSGLLSLNTFQVGLEISDAGNLVFPFGQLESISQGDAGEFHVALVNTLFVADFAVHLFYIDRGNVIAE